MTHPAQPFHELASLGLPVLCVDTCTLLDIIRDVTRDAHTAADSDAGLKLLSAAETGRLIVLKAEQVTIEIASNVAHVEKEGQDKLAAHIARVQRVDAVAAVFGSSGSGGVSHLAGHALRVRAVFDRWLATAKDVPSTATVFSRAISRVNEPRVPARKGKDSTKDCIIFESYLDAAAQLRSAGHDAPIVFASSNIREYCPPNSTQLHADFVADIGAVGMEYATSFGWAKHQLGL